MIAVWKFPKALWPAIGLIETPAKPLRHNPVPTSYEYCHRTVIHAQILIRRETVAQDQSDGKNSYVGLGYGGKVVVGRKQYDPGDLIGMLPRQISCNAGPERLAEKIDRAIRCEKFECLVSHLVEAKFARRTGAVFVSGILDHKNVQRRDLLDCIREMGALKGTTGIAVQNENLSLRRLNGR